ncbi:Zinc finger (C3HC4-type RING finger) family protein [Striga hermonthica]|uniref:Zinc finger (C3HC4-type RING finger) family protein n=1 Tax=Striga hermonthica TaxID=68872 RepID=A0A9N7R6V0_STRHE|nr:Zinc finger (C3HC4-type RING finger) family protein [Striga hermonthica]
MLISLNQLHVSSHPFAFVPFLFCFLQDTNICAICLSSMRPGHGHAIFTAECSHSFHFHCISSNVKHGKRSCPVCRAKWKEVPAQDPSHRIGSLSLSLPNRIPSPRADSMRRASSLLHAPEPPLFNDDDDITTDASSPVKNIPDHDNFNGLVEIRTNLEVSALPKNASQNDFSILVNLKAPTTPKLPQDVGQMLPTCRAPVDLVTVLDVSGSMAGTKLALLKRAMGFVIQNLGPSDRLSVISFSSTARRLFPLRRMTENGRQEALQAVNSLTSNGGTNIAEGLRKATKVLTECKSRNPIGSIILLSDGQDTYTNRAPPTAIAPRSDYQSIINGASTSRVPIHVFGFGSDHDADSMHLISENSGGTFSFIEAESVIQDAFAQCIGGLLSVVVQELTVEVECVDPTVRLVSVKSGSYKTSLALDKRRATIEVGDLYAEEERDFLVTADIPIYESGGEEMSLVKVKCNYQHLVGSNSIHLDSVSEVRIRRPVVAGPMQVSMEVDRQRNRVRSAEAMSEARVAAERGELALAGSILENCRKMLSETVSARGGDRLCLALDAELREMGERMASRQVYETSGRAYMLSGLSSHSWQRATARGDSTEGSGLVHAYQTPSMVDMVNLSQTMVLGSPNQGAIRPTRPQRRLDTTRVGYDTNRVTHNFSGGIQGAEIIEVITSTVKELARSDHKLDLATTIRTPVQLTKKGSPAARAWLSSAELSSDDRMAVEGGD